MVKMDGMDSASGLGVLSNAVHSRKFSCKITETPCVVSPLTELSSSINVKVALLVEPNEIIYHKICQNNSLQLTITRL